ncbi:MAG: hypothetical protein ABIT83_12310 [Massilia sp.]
MIEAPASAECRSLLADGAILTVTATRRPRGGRADVKCAGAGVAGLAERMQQVVRLARHTEARSDSRDQVVISIDRAPAPQERDWELALVLADRMVRGLYRPAAPVTANGWSEQWQLGRVDGHDCAAAPAHVLLGGADGLAWLGQLTGQPDSAPAVSTARAWFPLHSGGINDSLCWVEVSVYPLASDDDAVTVDGVDLTRQLAVSQALAGARHFDGARAAQWRTVVRFGQPHFQGSSFELALVMADRLARGREFLPRGRIIATGASNAWHAGRVEQVDAREAKCALILAQAVAGDRILLPKAWENELAPRFGAALAAKGASLACVERIGII